MPAIQVYIHDVYTLDFKMCFVEENKHLQFFSDQNFDSVQFKGRYVEQVLTSMESVLDEICEEIGVPNEYHNVTTENLVKKSKVTRNKLAYWLETVKYLLCNRAIPLLEKGVRVHDKVEKLQQEKIDDQKSIIELQKTVIEKRDEKLDSVQATVQKEIKTFSTVVSRSCASALAPRKIQTAVRKVTEETDRSRNFVIYGVEEKEAENLGEKVEEILQEIDEKPPVETSFRIGLKQAEKCRPVKVTLRSSDHVNLILKKSKLLRSKVGFRSIYLCPDRSVEERKAFKKLLEELRAKRSAETDSDKVYIIRNNKIITVMLTRRIIQYRLDRLDYFMQADHLTLIFIC